MAQIPRESSVSESEASGKPSTVFVRAVSVLWNSLKPDWWGSYRLLKRWHMSGWATAFSRSFEKNGRFVIGLQLLIKLGSRLCFFTSGLITHFKRCRHNSISKLFIICNNSGLIIGKRSLISLRNSLLFFHPLISHPGGVVCLISLQL